jgi:hypothetical protein
MSEANLHSQHSQVVLKTSLKTAALAHKCLNLDHQYPLSLLLKDRELNDV